MFVEKKANYDYFHNDLIWKGIEVLMLKYENEGKHYNDKNYAIIDSILLYIIDE